MKKQNKQPNKTTIKAEKIDYLAHFSKKTLYDYRLTDSESINLLRLLALSDNFNISLENTSKYLHISRAKLERVISQLKKYGYLEIERKGNDFIYKLRQESKYISAFNPRFIEYYDNKQLNAFLNNGETPQKYKNLIKKYFDALAKSESELLQTINEIKDFEKPQAEKEQQELNEIDIINYINGYK